MSPGAVGWSKVIRDAGQGGAMENGSGLPLMALVASVAVLSGIVFLRVRQPAMMGFIIAGIVIGPSGLKIVGQTESVRTIAELGVLLLLFVVGLEISLRSLRKILGVVFLCAALQSAAALAITAGLGWLLGWPVQQTVLVGFVLSLSSTAVGINLLHNIGELHHRAGRITMGVLVAQDLLMIPMLITVGFMGREENLSPAVLLEIGGAILFLFLLVFFLSRREKLRIPFTEEIGRDRDAGPVAAVAFCLVLAALSSLLGLSASYGAFIAGLVLGASTLRARVLHVATPVQSILMTVFFLSIGLMVDIWTVLTYLPVVLILLLAVLAVKTIVNIIVLRLLKITPREAVIASVTMAQVGEFSFVVAAAGLAAGAISDSGHQIALAVIALSLIASPLWMLTARRVVDRRATAARSVLELLDEVFEPELAALDRFRDAARRWLSRRRAHGRRDNDGADV